MTQESKRHDPPKYVDGCYKPHFTDPDADYVLMQASMMPQHISGALYWATTDDGGDAAGVVRRLDGRPITEGADKIVGYCYDGEIEYHKGEYIDFSEYIDDENVPPLP